MWRSWGAESSPPSVFNQPLTRVRAIDKYAAMNTSYRPGADIQLPLGTAIWVLAAHLYAILVPLVLVAVSLQHWEYIRQVCDYPLLLLAAAGMMMAGSQQ